MATDGTRPRLTGRRPAAVLRALCAVLVVTSGIALGAPGDRELCLGPGSDEAIRACQAEVRGGQGDYDVYTALGKHLNAASRFQEAIEVFDEALGIYRGDSRLRKLLEIAQSNLRERQWTAQRKRSSQPNSSSGQSAELKLNRLYCRTRKGQEALSACEQVLAAAPDDVDARSRRSELLTELRAATDQSTVADAGSREVQPASQEATPRAPAPGALDRQRIATIQELLNRLGLDAGPVDGLAGQRTLAAAREFTAFPGMSEVSPELDDTLADALEAAVDRDLAARDWIASARSKARAGQLDEALAEARSAQELAPWNVLAGTVAGELETQIGERDDRAHQRAEAVRRTLAAVDNARAAGDLATAESLVAQAIEEYPQEVEFKLLAQEIASQRTRQAQEQERQRLARASELLARARAARSEGAFERALRLVSEGLALAPGDQQLLVLREQIQADQARAEEASRVYAEAQALHRAGDLAASLAQIEEGLRLLPEHRGLQELAANIEAEQAQIARAAAAAAQRNRQAGQHLANAQAARRAGELEVALEHVARGTELVADHRELLALRSELENEIERARAARQEADRRLAEAERSYAAGNFESSLELIEEGLRHVPDHRGLLALKDSAGTELARLELARAEAAARDQEAQRHFDLGSNALRDGALEDALAYAEQGLAVVPDHAALLTLKASVATERVRLHEERARQERHTQWLNAKLEEARTARQRGQLEASLALVAEGLAREPEHGGLLDLQAAVTDEIGEREANRANFDNLLDQARDAVNGDDLNFAERLLARAAALIPDDERVGSLRQLIDEQRAVQIESQVALLRARARRRLEDAREGVPDASLEDRLAALEETQREIDKGWQLAPGDQVLAALGKQVEAERRQVEERLATARERARQVALVRRKLDELNRDLALFKAEREAAELSSRVLAQKVLEAQFAKAP